MTLFLAYRITYSPFSDNIWERLPLPRSINYQFVTLAIMLFLIGMILGLAMTKNFKIIILHVLTFLVVQIVLLATGFFEGFLSFLILSPILSALILTPIFKNLTEEQDVLKYLFGTLFFAHLSLFLFLIMTGSLYIGE